MKLKYFRPFLFLSLFAFTTASLQAAPTKSRPELAPIKPNPAEETLQDSNSTPVTTEYPSFDPTSAKLPSEEMRRKQHKKAAAFIIGTIITITAGLLISGADTGKDAPSSP